MTRQAVFLFEVSQQQATTSGAVIIQYDQVELGAVLVVVVCQNKRLMNHTAIYKLETTLSQVMLSWKARIPPPRFSFFAVIYKPELTPGCSYIHPLYTPVIYTPVIYTRYIHPLYIHPLFDWMVNVNNIKLRGVTHVCVRTHVRTYARTHARTHVCTHARVCMSIWP